MIERLNAGAEEPTAEIWLGDMEAIAEDPASGPNQARRIVASL